MVIPPTERASEPEEPPPPPPAASPPPPPPDSPHAEAVVEREALEALPELEDELELVELVKVPEIE